MGVEMPPVVGLLRSGLSRDMRSMRTVARGAPSRRRKCSGSPKPASGQDDALGPSRIAGRGAYARVVEVAGVKRPELFTTDKTRKAITFHEISWPLARGTSTRI